VFPLTAGRGRARVLLAGLVLALMGTPIAPPALGAMETSRPTQAGDPLVEQALAELTRARDQARQAAERLEATADRRAAVEARVVAVEAEVAALAARIEELRAEIKTLRARLRARAAALYAASGTLSESGISLELSLDDSRRRVLAAAAGRADNRDAENLTASIEEMKAARTALGKEQAALDAERGQLAQLEERLQSEQAELDRRVDAANAALAQARALGALRANGEPLMGLSVLSPETMAAYVRAKGYRPRLAPGTSLEALARIYVEEGNAEHVRGDLAFAQSIIETGGFASAPGNNYAGMGWCDSCSTGRVFPTPRDGVRAQIQHLRNYADASSRAANLAFPPSPYWYDANPVRAARKFDTFFAKGWAPTWHDMGGGNWATDPNYSGKVLRVYAAMVAFSAGS
jgi:peptidoglycan hydrolase CwlO-like protein